MNHLDCGLQEHVQHLWEMTWSHLPNLELPGRDADISMTQCRARPTCSLETGITNRRSHSHRALSQGLPGVLSPEGHAHEQNMVTGPGEPSFAL